MHTSNYIFIGAIIIFVLQEDVRILKEMGFDAYKSRLLPSKTTSIYEFFTYPVQKKKLLHTTKLLESHFGDKCFLIDLTYCDYLPCVIMSKISFQIMLIWIILSDGKLSGGVNKGGVQYYKSRIDELLANGAQLL